MTGDIYISFLHCNGSTTTLLASFYGTPEYAVENNPIAYLCDHVLWCKIAAVRRLHRNTGVITIFPGNVLHFAQVRLQPRNLHEMLQKVANSAE